MSDLTIHEERIKNAGMLGGLEMLAKLHSPDNHLKLARVAMEQHRVNREAALQMGLSGKDTYWLKRAVWHLEEAVKLITGKNMEEENDTSRSTSRCA